MRYLAAALVALDVAGASPAATSGLTEAQGEVGRNAVQAFLLGPETA